ncbi:formin-like protein 20-like [Hibiscus syriacus]|uniref:Formin-like protein 20-like n=1 Tax=Hibiscus syriacus TaxID=106335 RepID=A0A6A2WNJ4_HIBSY|nr:uncharacterized protein LOC120187233 [Hibiscus syriacus]KAE8661758.1 formin-like protein 20-like [Hibiscus syriacus]
MEDTSRTQSHTIMRRSIYTFLQNYHYFTTIAAVLAFPYALSILLSQFFVLHSPLFPAIHTHLKAVFMAAEFPPSSNFFNVLSLKISQTVSSSIFALPFTVSFFLLSKVSIINLLKHNNPTSPMSFSSISSLYNPLFSTFVCNSFLLLAANSTTFSLLFFGYHSINGLGFSLSPNWLTFMSAAGAVVYSMILANVIVICNLALVSSGMENSGGYLAILKACVLIKGRTLTSLALAVPPNLALAAIEALFHYRVVVRAYGYRSEGDYGGFLLALEGVLIAYLYSLFVVLDTVVSCMFFKSCKTGCLADGRYCYKIEIVAERDGKAFVKLKNIEEFA